jgi:hypothetical protein
VTELASSFLAAGWSEESAAPPLLLAAMALRSRPRVVEKSAASREGLKKRRCSPKASQIFSVRRSSSSVASGSREVFF